MKYNLDDRLPILPTLLYGLQWWIVSLPCVIIIGSVIGKIHFSEIAAQTLYLQKIFIIMGFTTLVQIFWGHRLPLVIGPASVLLVGVLASLSAGISAIYTSIAVGGLIIAILAFSGILTGIRNIFTIRVVTVILILIPFTLMPTILKLVFDNNHHSYFNLIFVFVLIIALLLCNKWLRGIWKSTTIVLGIVAGTFVYYLLQGFPVIETVDYNQNLSFSSLFIDFEFDMGTIIAFVFCFIALIVNELGSIEAVGQMLHADNIGKRVKYGVGISGVSNILSGSLGIVGSVDYSMSTGVISATGCASRYTLIPAAIGLMACAFIPHAVNLLNHIPSIVMGTLLLYLMASQLSSGFTMMTSEKAVSTFNDGIVIGLPLMIAILISFIPGSALNQIPDIIRPIISNGFVVGVIAVLLLEHLIFRKSKNTTEDN